MEKSKRHCELIAQAIYTLQPEVTERLTLEAIRAGVGTIEIIEQGINPGMQEVSTQYEADEYHLPELLMAEEALGKSIRIIETHTPNAQLEEQVQSVQRRLEELSKLWVDQLSSCVTRLFRYDEERKRATGKDST
jgi:methanogenic corrinoid protein MtbC1